MPDTPTEELAKKLDRLFACESGCEGRCEFCPDEVGRAGAARLRELEAENKRLREADNSCCWYWSEEETSSDTCLDCWQEVVEYHDPGTVVCVLRGGVVEAMYCAVLDAAEDADSDDYFEVCEPTREAADAKINAEIARRTALKDSIND